MQAKKLLVDDKITACVINKYVSWVFYGKRIEKHYLVKHFAFLENVKICAVFQVTHCFLTSYWLAHDQLSWNVFLFSRHPIGQHCLGSPSYKTRTVILNISASLR